ncbi:hypothetical protein BCON_0193g00080 [Botryotinia convoluta]|uniref:Uncharacterized protein n=1 Tax=Botryotinia convoluta TaxID=54673 RepID=A0A4Z1HZG0_9HELO|nr:hypothetical protein BCON_0193g00080 [Botryotinia convoluta]
MHASTHKLTSLESLNHMFLSLSRFIYVGGLGASYDHYLPYPQLLSDPANSAMAAMPIAHCPLRIDFLMSNCTGMPMAPESQNFIRSGSKSTESLTPRV